MPSYHPTFQGHPHLEKTSKHTIPGSLKASQASFLAAATPVVEVPSMCFPLGVTPKAGTKPSTPAIGMLRNVADWVAKQRALGEASSALVELLGCAKIGSKDLEAAPRSVMTVFMIFCCTSRLEIFWGAYLWSPSDGSENTTRFQHRLP